MESFYSTTGRQCIVLWPKGHILLSHPLNRGIVDERFVSAEVQRQGIALLNEEVDFRDLLSESCEDCSLRSLDGQKKVIAFSHFPYDLAFDGFHFLY